MKPPTIAALAALSALCLGACTERTNGPAGGPAPGADAPQDDAMQTHTGTLRGGMAGIGGEHTGWILERPGESTLEVDVSRVRNDAARLEGRRVVVTGRTFEKRYVERGTTTILVIETLGAADE